MSKILTWWNNLPYCKMKKQEWIMTQRKAYRNLGAIHWANDVCHEKADQFVETDWVYCVGDRCEEYIMWFFGWRTKRCTVVARRPRYIPGSSGSSSISPDVFPHYCTYYDVVRDNGGKSYCAQSDLSY